MFIIGLLLLVSPERVACYIEQLSGTNLWGKDGIHAVQLKALPRISFISQFSILFVTALGR